MALGLLSLQEAFQRRVNASPIAVRKRAQWQQRGDRYLASYPTMPRGSLVQVDPSLQRRIVEHIEAAFPSVASAFNRHLVPVAERAFNEWPVLTGLSKSLLALEFGLTSETTLRGSIANTAPYAFFINRGADVRDLVFKPAEAAADAMARDIGSELA